MSAKRTQQRTITNLARAWRYLAEQVLVIQTLIPGSELYLCFLLQPGEGRFTAEVDYLMSRIAPATRARMREQITHDLEQGSPLLDYDDEECSGEIWYHSNEQRVLRCLFFALEAAEAQTKWSAR